MARSRYLLSFFPCPQNLEAYNPSLELFLYALREPVSLLSLHSENRFLDLSLLDENLLLNKIIKIFAKNLLNFFWQPRWGKHVRNHNEKSLPKNQPF